MNPGMLRTTTPLTLAAALLVGASGAAAQTIEPARISASVAAGIAKPVHSDLRFTAREWQLAVRARVARYVVMEVFMDEWRHSDEQVFRNVPLTGPDGPIGSLGRIDELRDTTVHTTDVIGWNTLLQGQIGRVSIFAGGGPSYMVLRRVSTATVTGCTAIRPSLCDGSRSSHTGSAFSVQPVGGLEVAITSRVAAFGQFQFPMPIDDPGSGHASTTGGVRVRLW